MDINQYKGALEAMLFACAEPVAAPRLAEILDIETTVVVKLLNQMKDSCAEQDRGIVLLQFDDRWQLATNNAYASFVTEILDRRRNVPLTQSALEILAVIAYNQPVSRMFVEQVRGVDSTSGITGLVNKGLIEEQGRLDLPGRPIAYGTTDVFLRTFGLSSLEGLPSLTGDNEVFEPLEEEL